MERNQHISSYVHRVTLKIDQSQDEWKGYRFASYDDSNSQPDEQDDQIENQSYLQKYRGKSGDVKPLGLVLYYCYLRYLIILFFILTIISLPSIIVYSQSGGLTEFFTQTSFSKSILLLSIANLPRYRLDLLTSEQLQQISFHRSLTIFCDTVCVIVVMVFIIYWKVVSTKISNDYTSRSPEPHQYCLKVKNIKGYTEEQLKNHFQRFGKVAQISCIHSYKDTMIGLRKIVKLIGSLKGAKPDQLKYQQIIQKITQSYYQLAQKYLAMPEPQIVQCYIIFQTIQTRNRVADLYKYRICQQKLAIRHKNAQQQGTLQCLDVSVDMQTIKKQSTNNQQKKSPFSKNKKQLNMRSSSMLQKGTTQKLSPPSNQKIEEILIPRVSKCRYEPLTINWQNSNISKKDQRGKFIFQGILVIIMICMILMALFLLNINSTHVRQSTSSPQLHSTSQDSIMKENSNNLDINKFKNDQKMLYTFCASLNYSNFKWDYYEVCENYFQLERNRFALMLLFALMVAVINLMTNRILWALVAFRRYKTLAGRNKFLITSIFLFSLINSAILLLMVRGNYTGPILRKVVGYILGFPQQVMQVKIYPQFNRQWYMNIGSQLMVNYVVSLITFPHFHVFLHWVRSLYRKFISKKSGKIIKNPNFNYCTFYALSLKAMFFAMLYSNCMPIFYSLCFLSLIVQRYVGKFLLKNFVDQPVFVDNNAIQVAVSIIPYSLLLHCLTSILFINVDDILPEKDSFFMIEKSWLQKNIIKFENGPTYIILMIIIILFIWHRRRIEKILVKYWLGRNQQALKSQIHLKFSEIRNNPAFLASYRMKDNPKYKILYHALALFQAHMKAIREINEKKKTKKQIIIEENTMAPKQQPTQSNFVRDTNLDSFTFNEIEEFIKMKEKQFEEKFNNENSSDDESYEELEEEIDMVNTNIEKQMLEDNKFQPKKEEFEIDKSSKKQKIQIISDQDCQNQGQKLENYGTVENFLQPTNSK